MFTSLYLTKVLPASTPPADLKMIVMVGPSLRIRWIAIPMATTAARIGIIQTTEIRWRRLGTTVARGRLSGLSAMLGLCVNVLFHPAHCHLDFVHHEDPSAAKPQPKSEGTLHHEAHEEHEVRKYKKD